MSIKKHNFENLKRSKVNRTSIDITKEQMVKDFRKRLMEAYGYQEEQLALSVSIQTGQTVDIAIWRNKKARQRQQIPDLCVVVVCKAEHIRIQADDYISSLRLSSIDTSYFFVAHNMKETCVFYMDRYYEGSLEKFGDFPKAADLEQEEGLTNFVRRMRNCTKDGLLQAFNKCHNIIRNNDKLSPEAAFDEISKVIFVKMLYERKPNDELIYTKEKFLRDESDWQKKHKKGDYISSLFDQVKRQYIGDGLFERGDRLRISRESFIKILEELNSFGLAGVAEDVKGVAFESFLGKTFRGELGQFFTPRTIVNYIVDVLDIQEGELVCDPCCGSGGFLIRAFEKVQDDIDKDIRKKIQEIAESILTVEQKHEQIALLQNQLDKRLKDSRYYKLCHSYFFGVDANVRMARTSKMNMIMHGDGHVGVYLHDGLFDVGGVIAGKFDVILINPPFGAHVDRKTKMNNRKSVSDLFELTASNAELLFVERTIQLLKPGGRAGLVLPEGIFNNNNSNTKKLRNFVEQNAQIMCITSIPADVFLASGANIKPSILFIKKLSDDEKKKGKKGTWDFCACKVTDAGINSQGLPSDNRQLTELAPLVREWIRSGEQPNSSMVRMVNLEIMEDWNVQPFFNVKPVRFKIRKNITKLSDILEQSTDWIIIDNDTQYTRITVRLFNKGIVLRDRVYGREIGTKKQMRVRAGQLVVSKIDGKSGAFAFVPQEFDGAIVTQDFPVFNIDKKKVLPEYLELLLSNSEMLEQIKSTASGSTGRKRLSVPKFLSTRIPLPSIDEQCGYVNRLIELRRQQEILEENIKKEIACFNDTIFDS